MSTTLRTLLAVGLLASAARADILINGSFETPRLEAPPFDSLYRPVGATWSFSNYAGIAAVGPNSPWFTGPAADGSQVALLEFATYGDYANQIPSIAQTMSGLIVGQQYRIDFYYAVRHGIVGAQYNVADGISLLVGGAVLETVTPTLNTFALAPSATFVATAPSEVLEFQGAAGCYDCTTLIDNVQVTAAPVPEPGSVALLLTALAGIGLAARKRSRRGAYFA